MSLIRPAFKGTDEEKKRAFDIGISAHNQVEAKFNAEGVIKEHAYQFEREEYVIETHPDIYYPLTSTVVEIKSLRYIVEYLQESVMQLSAYKALLEAETGLFLIYQGKMEGDRFTVTSVTPFTVALLPKEVILSFLDLRARELLTKYRAEGLLT